MRPASPSAVTLLRVATLWNLPSSIYPPVAARNASSNASPVFADLFSILNLGFGAGYFFASRNLKTYWPYVALGVAGKAAVAGWGGWHWMNGTADGVVAATAATEGVLAVMYYVVLSGHADVNKGEGRVTVRS